MLPDLWIMPGTGWVLKSYGFMMMVGFLSGVYLAMRRAGRVKCDPDAVLNCAFIALLVGLIGARVFYVIHYWDESFAFMPSPFIEALNVTQGGLEFLGGLIPAMILVPLYLRLTCRSVRVYTDILTVATMWALGVARIGCFLNGCCFGGVCVNADNDARTAVAVQFPFGSPAYVRQWEERKVTLPAELIADGYPALVGARMWPITPLGRDALYMSPEKRDKPKRKFERIERAYKEATAIDPEGEETKQLAREYERQKKIHGEHQAKLAFLSAATQFSAREDPTHKITYTELRELADHHPALWAHPTQLYSAVSAILLSILLARVFHRRKQHGVVFGLMMVTYPLARVPLELIRADNPYDVAGMTVSQAISVVMFVLGLIYLFVLYRFLPQRSPRAVPFVPEESSPPTRAG